MNALGVPQAAMQAGRNALMDEQSFQSWITDLPWYREFQQRYGETPNLQDPDYDYRAAYHAGIEPQRYAPDGGAYHWPSSTADGNALKSENHPTVWAEHFMQKFGYDPIAKGLSKEQGIQMMGQR